MLGAKARIGGYECRAECAFGKDGAEVIGQPKRDEERIRDGSGAEDRRHDHVAQEPRDPRDQGEAANREDALDHHLPYRRCAASLQDGRVLTLARDAWLR